MKELIDKLKQDFNKTNISDDEKNELFKTLYLLEKQSVKMDFKLQSLFQNIKITKRILNNFIEEIEQKNIEIQNYANALEEANKTKDRFFSIIAHDLKSPFNILIGFSELIKLSIKEKDFDEVKKLNDIILQTSTHTHKLLLNLLDWSRAQTNEIKFRPVKININNFITENIELFKAQAHKKGLILEFNPAESIYVFADVDMTNIIIRNLISNAVKYTKKGSITISTGKQENICLIIIMDTGIGIQQEIIDRIFNIDENIWTLGTDGERGTGLGLILCKEFIGKNKGSIFIESIVNKGSIFTIKLPLFVN